MDINIVYVQTRTFCSFIFCLFMCFYTYKFIVRRRFKLIFGGFVYVCMRGDNKQNGSAVNLFENLFTLLCCTSGSILFNSVLIMREWVLGFGLNYVQKMKMREYDMKSN